MSTITKRQTYWRDHVLAAAAFYGSIVEYATLHNRKTKDIYQWKTALTKRCCLLTCNRQNTIPPRTAYFAMERSLRMTLSVSCLHPYIGTYVGF